MDEYIKKDDVLNLLSKNSITKKITFADGVSIYDSVKNMPTADVAPRAEVANKICCEIEEEIVAALESNYRALKEWDDGRCNVYILEMVNRIKGKIDALRGMEAFVEELKSKYAEVQK